MKQWLWILLVWAIWNVVTFFQMGLDKKKAEKGKRRISEKTLLICAFFMGAAGSGAGMLYFHHKTLKWKFRVLVPLAAVCNLAVVCGAWYLISLG